MNRELLAANIVLGFVWGIVTGSFTLPNLALGFVLGTAALYLIREEVGGVAYLGRVRRIAGLSILFLKELLLSAVKVARIVLQREMPLNPAFVTYPLTVQGDGQITLLANLITLTPGTLSVDVSEDRRILYIHAIDAPDLDALRADIASGFERKIIEAFP